MAKWKKIVLWTAGPLLLLAIAVFAMLSWSIRPTTGPRIGAYQEPRTALLIIDIQEDYTGPQAKKPYHDGDRIVRTANALLAQAEQKGIPVVYIQNVFDNPVVSFFTGGINAPGAPGTSMDRRLLQVPGAPTFTKGRSDAFSNPAFEAWLRAHRVDRLLIAGLDGAYCVNATGRGALNRGYKVTFYPDGIATETGKSIDTLAQGWRDAGAQVKTGTEL
jgi:nicotinamidase-related amidase